MNPHDSLIRTAIKSVKGSFKEIYWRFYKLFLNHPPMPHAPTSLLFVCKGNICRSPFAEAMAQRHVPEGVAIRCRSAGIHVRSPESCPRETVEAAERFGIDLSGHKSRQIDAELVAGADMVFAMEAWQAGHLRKAFAEHRGKIHLLPRFEVDSSARKEVGRQLNIHDPYGRSIEEFIECFDRIESCLKGVFNGIHCGAIRLSPDRNVRR